MTPQTKAQRPARSPSRAREKAAADRRAFDASRAQEVSNPARDVLRELYALRDANYFRNHPTDTGALSVACAALEAALHEKQNHEVSK